jgi:hypothetical protein
MSAVPKCNHLAGKSLFRQLGGWGESPPDVISPNRWFFVHLISSCLPVNRPELRNSP